MNAHAPVGRKARPRLERELVRAGAAFITEATGMTHGDPIARILARQVKEELAAYISEGDDPLAASLGEAQRMLFPTPAARLATDPDVDTISLFVEERVSRVRAREGQYLPPESDKAECRAILADLEARLVRRYLRHLRT